MKYQLVTKKTVLLAFTFASMYANAQKVNVEVGKSFKVSIATDGTTEMMGNEEPSKVNITSTIKIVSLEKDTYKGTKTLSRMQMDGSSMGTEIKFDSDKKEDMEGPMAMYLGKGVGKATDFTLDKITGAYKEKTEESADGGMGEMMSGGSSNAGGIFYFSIMGKKQGEKWVETTNIDGIKTVTNYEVQSITGNVATVVMSSVTNGSTTKEMMGKSVDVTIDSKGSSTLTVDILTGILKQSTSNMEMSTTMDQGGQSMAIGSKSKIIVTVE